jgi:hypothetical protein
MTKCPKCRRPGQTVPGYIVTGNSIVRCDVCKGWGFCSLRAIMAFELTGHGLTEGN